MDNASEQHRPLFAFLHIPKTGGTTICHHMVRNCEEGEIISAYNTVEGVKAIDHFRDMTQEEQNRVRAVFGHNVYMEEIENFFEDRDVMRVVFLRDPVDRILSLYNFFRRQYDEENHTERHWGLFSENGEIRSLRQWFEYRKGYKDMNHVGYVLEYCTDLHTGEQFLPTWDHFQSAKCVLDECAFVGLMEQSEDFSICYTLMGVPVSHMWRENVSVRSYIEMSEQELEDMKHYIRMSLPYAQELYEYAKVLNKAQKAWFKKHGSAALQTNLAKSLTCV
ncbi:MAG: sulfotransferase family protein [Kiritimatiellales bacterium]|nr:sulfotransferase family protein [Kiritimatiellales bacterium]